MNILVGTDYYYPSVGGQQIVLKEISERLVKLGHSVTVVTSSMPNRDATIHNSVIIKEFDVNGSYVHGLTGKVKDYQDYVLKSDFDAILIKAAQGWTIDALIPILDKIKTRKVFIPCGFSALYDPHYSEYYELMSDVLSKFDHLIFYATDYRDINFARDRNITNYSIIPNGASEIEFSVPQDSDFRERLNIDQNDFVILTVGSFTGGKGHYELAQAFQSANFGKPATLILNGNLPSSIPKLKITKRIKQYTKMGPRSMVRRIYRDVLQNIGINKPKPIRDWTDITREVNSTNSDKKIIITDLERKDVVQAFLNSDLFVFASNVEYSPLVLFESAAAGLPFLTVPVGNSKEIIEWTQGGTLCPAPFDKNGRTRVDPQVLADEMVKLAKDSKKLKQLGIDGKKNWSKRLTWEKITREYEKILQGNNL